MNVAYACPRCDRTASAVYEEHQTALDCPHCGHPAVVPTGAVHEGRVQRCLVCGGRELFVRKDFSQRLGVTIVVLGFAASCVTWYFHRVYATFGILFATALVDVLLYVLVGNMLECYRCHAQYRGKLGLGDPGLGDHDLGDHDLGDHGFGNHEPFNLETHERCRQQAARLVESPPNVSANQNMP
jgi:DNA-directed RNA polymerase subunit RPC12/RpoP